MNLIGDPWIPVCNAADGASRQVSLAELFRDAEAIADLDVPPPQRVALMRLLLAITHRALNGPRDEAEWRAARGRIQPAALAYLESMTSKFELYGPGAFLQADELEQLDNAALSKLDFTLAAGNSHTVWDHLATTARNYPPAWQALMLLTYQNLSPGGRIGVGKWCGKPTAGGGSSSAAPALEGSPLHLFLLGGNLLETIHLNLIDSERSKVAFGVPVWEKAPAGPDDTGDFLRSYCGRLAPFSRAIKLSQDSPMLTLANGFSYPQLPDFVDPLLAKKRNPKDDSVSYLRLNPDKHPWRELAAILATRSDDGTVSPALNLLNRNRLADDRIVTIWCGGVAVDKAKFEFIGEWRFAFEVGTITSDGGVGLLRNEILLAEESANALKSAITSYVKHFFDKENPGDRSVKQLAETLRTRAMTDFWHRLNDGYPVLENAARRLDPAPWRQVLRKTATEVFAAVCPADSPRHLEALAKSRGYLGSSLAKLLNTNPAKEEQAS